MSTASLDRFLETYSRIATTNRARFNVLHIVLTRFRQQGIDCILLKGADLIPRLYGVLGLRPMVDVDLLVRERDLPAIDRAMRELGFLPQISGNPVYRDPENQLALDMTTEVWYSDDLEGIWRRAAPRTVAGVPVKGMGADDLLIYLTAYSVLNRGYFAPSFSKDIALLAGQEPLDWEFILAEAVRHNLKIPLHHGLLYAVQQEAVPIPDGILARLAPSTTSEKALAFILHKLVMQTSVAGAGHFLLFITQPGTKKWRRLRHALWPSPAFLKYRYGGRGETFPTRTRLARALHLTIQAHRLLARILYRLAA